MTTLNDNEQGGGPSPELFMQRLRSIHESAAVKSAVELRVFTKLAALCPRGQRFNIVGSGGIGAGSSMKRVRWAGATAAEMAQACGCAEKGMRVLLDTLATGRFVRKRPSTKGVSKRKKDRDRQIDK